MGERGEARDDFTASLCGRLLLVLKLCVCWAGRLRSFQWSAKVQKHSEETRPPASVDGRAAEKAIANQKTHGPGQLTALQDFVQSHFITNGFSPDIII